MHGQFIWYDLMSSDAGLARKFYPHVLGWKTQEWKQSKPGQRYTMWMLGGQPLGGVAQVSEALRARGIKSHWIPTVEVRDVDKTVRQAQTLGGQVHFGPEDVPGTGRYAGLADPQGASFAVFTPSRPTPAFDGTPMVGRFSWHELMTSDSARAFDFYRELFDWEKTSDFDMGGGNLYRMFGRNGVPYGGMYNRAPELAHVAPNWLSYVNVKDVRKTTAAARKAGAKLVNGPMEVPGGDWIAAFTDPTGAAFAIHQRAAQGAQASATQAQPGTDATATATPRRPARKQSRRKKSARKSARKRPARVKSPARKSGSKASAVAPRRSATQKAKRAKARRSFGRRRGGSR